MKKVLFVTIAVLMVVFVFLFFELICRVLNLTDKVDADFKFYVREMDNDIDHPYNREDALLMWSPTPNAKFENIEINSKGLRDKEYSYSKEDNVFRILCLGDSSTFGHGVSVEDTYHSMLEEKLNREGFPPDIKFEVINGGVTGYTSFQGLMYYKYRGYRFKPDIVTFYFGENDWKCNFSLSDKEVIGRNGFLSISLIKNRFLLKSHFYRVLRKTVLEALGRYSIEYKPNVRRVSLEEFRQNILQLNKLCKRDGARLLLIKSLCVRHPRAYQKELQNIVKGYKIPIIVVNEIEKLPKEERIKYFLDAVHPNKLGHKELMIEIYKWTMENTLNDNKG